MFQPRHLHLIGERDWQTAPSPSAGTSGTIDGGLSVRVTGQMFVPTSFGMCVTLLSSKPMITSPVQLAVVAEESDHVSCHSNPFSPPSSQQPATAQTSPSQT